MQDIQDINDLRDCEEINKNINVKYLTIQGNEIQGLVTFKNKKNWECVISHAPCNKDALDIHVYLKHKGHKKDLFYPIDVMHEDHVQMSYNIEDAADYISNSLLDNYRKICYLENNTVPIEIDKQQEQAFIRQLNNIYFGDWKCHVNSEWHLEQDIDNKIFVFATEYNNYKIYATFIHKYGGLMSLVNVLTEECQPSGNGDFGYSSYWPVIKDLTFTEEHIALPEGNNLYTLESDILGIFSALTNVSLLSNQKNAAKERKENE